MGTITRTFANNITTSGVFKPTAFNNASFDNVTAVPGGAVEGGNMVLLSTQTASGDASISFTTGIDSTYKEYMFIWNNCQPSVDSATLGFQASTDGGSSYGVTATTTFFKATNREDNSFASLSYDAGQDLTQSTNDVQLSLSIGSLGSRSSSGILNIYNPSDTTYVKHFISTSSDRENRDRLYNNYGAGYFNSTTALNAFIFRMNSSANITDGTIQMFGIL
jgi:hypothetical protein